MITDISVHFFRNYSQLSLSIDERLVLICGQNGIGKTNLLEGIYFGLNGRGFRSDNEGLVMAGEEQASVALRTKSGDRQAAVQRRGSSLQQRFLLNSNPVSFRKKFAHSGPVVLFEPEEMRMLTGPPNLRRGWLDSVLGKTTDEYETQLKNYNRALRQRNKLLKTGVTAEDQYFVWELKLSEYGQLITNQRALLSNELNNELFNELYKKISSNQDTVFIEYKLPASDYSSWLANALRLSREHDQRLGHTSVGPHRDDFSLTRNGTALQSTGSRGEIRSAVLALKLFEMQKLEEYTKIKPVLLLDDVLSELDITRRKSLLKALVGHQTFITATEIDNDLLNGVDHQIIQL